MYVLILILSLSPFNRLVMTYPDRHECLMAGYYLDNQALSWDCAKKSAWEQYMERQYE
jgi:hypothetical protein